jgi:hypothetical protein
MSSQYFPACENSKVIGSPTFAAVATMILYDPAVFIDVLVEKTDQYLDLKTATKERI